MSGPTRRPGYHAPGTPLFLPPQALGTPVFRGPCTPGAALSWLPQAPGIPCPKHPTIPAAPGFGDPLLRGPSAPETHYPGRPSTRGLLSRPACEPRAPQLQAPRRAPRAALPLPVSHCGAWSLSAPALLHPSFPPWGLGSALHPLCPLPVGSLPQVCLCLPSLLPLLPAPLSLVFHSPVHSSE